MSPPRVRNSRHVLGMALVVSTLAATLCMVVTALPASAGTGGTFVPVAVGGTCSLTSGFSTGGVADCGAGIAGAKYIYLPDNGSSLTYALTVPAATSETLTYGIPAGGFVNTVAATVSLDGGPPVTLDADLGAFDQTTPSDLPLWTSSWLGPGSHTWTITSTGDAENVYGLWTTTLSTSLSGGSQSGTAISVSSGTAVTDGATLTDTNAATATGTVTYDVYSDSACTVEVSAGSPEPITTPGTLPPSSPVTLPVVGTYYWQASYSGDAHNAAATSTCGSETETVVATTGCIPGTTSCAATFSAPSQSVEVAGTKPSSTTANIVVVVATGVLSCTNFAYAAPVASLTDSGLQTDSDVVVTDTVNGLPSKKGVVVCYQPSGPSPPAPAFLVKCHGSKFVGACSKSIKEVGGSVVAVLELPTGDPRYHVGGETPLITSFHPTAPRTGKKLTIKGENLSEVTGVTIGGVPASITKTAPTHVSVIVPPGTTGGIVAVSSLAGVVTSLNPVTVSAS